MKRAVRPLRLRAGAQLDRGRVYFFVVPQGLDLYGQAADVAWLEARIKRATPDLVIVGPIYKLAIGDPISEEVARRVSAVLDRLRVQYGFALLIEAHVLHGQGGNRPERPYGASLWLRWPEFGLYLSQTGTLSHWRGNATSGSGRPRSSGAETGRGCPTAIPERCCGGGSSPASTRTGAPIPSPGWRGCWASATGRSSERTEWEELKKALGEAE